ncbi:MAG: Gfo/Idh/MocA family oxidoreductase [candidate division Zixibacteria bacterium]|nr:Gfo/Idh/MocA family oxidoreductase [candidate division Zixibacteria bacterium]
MIKIAVIGIGHLGKNHARVYKNNPGCKLVGIYDTDSKLAEKIASENDVKSFGSLNELLSESDAVSIATPTTSHFDIGMEAIAEGKHLLIEKPVTTTVEQAEQLIEKAEVKNVKLQVGHIERFNPAFSAVFNYIDKPLFIEAHRLTQFAGRGIEVDVILDLMIHDIDIILNMTGEEPTEIRGAGAPVLTETSDIANVRLEFPSGCTANITASRISAHPMRKMRIFQKAGYISVDFAERKPEVYLLRENEDNSSDTAPIFRIPSGIDGKSIQIIKPEAKEVDMLEEELGSFISAIANDSTPIVDGHAGLKALKIALQIIELLPKVPSN